MKYLWTEDTGAGLHFWKLVNQLFFDDALAIESKGCKFFVCFGKDRMFMQSVPLFKCLVSCSTELTFLVSS